MKTVKQALIEARATIDTPQKWCRLSLALDSEGRATRPNSPDACRFCIAGSVKRVTEPERRIGMETAVLSELGEALFACKIGLYDHGILAFNDSYGTTHAQVMKVFDYAIERVEE